MACGVALSARGLDGGREEALRVQAIEKTSAREEGVKSRMAGRRVASSERAREDRGMPLDGIVRRKWGVLCGGILREYRHIN